MPSHGVPPFPCGDPEHMHACTLPLAHSLRFHASSCMICAVDSRGMHMQLAARGQLALWRNPGPCNRRAVLRAAVPDRKGGKGPLYFSGSAHFASFPTRPSGRDLVPGLWRNSICRTAVSLSCCRSSQLTHCASRCATRHSGYRTRTTATASRASSRSTSLGPGKSVLCWDPTCTEAARLVRQGTRLLCNYSATCQLLSMHSTHQNVCSTVPSLHDVHLLKT
jgi:hypothetical protein